MDTSTNRTDTSSSGELCSPLPGVARGEHSSPLDDEPESARGELRNTLGANRVPSSGEQCSPDPSGIRQLKDQPASPGVSRSQRFDRCVGDARRPKLFLGCA
jgi:hypothetical protein